MIQWGGIHPILSALESRLYPSQYSPGYLYKAMQPLHLSWKALRLSHALSGRVAGGRHGLLQSTPELLSPAAM